jgi:hypothetical protein
MIVCPLIVLVDYQIILYELPMQFRDDTEINDARFYWFSEKLVTGFD